MADDGFPADRPAQEIPLLPRARPKRGARKPGRPPTPINIQFVEKAAQAGATWTEIAALVGLSEMQLMKRLKREKLVERIEANRRLGRLHLRMKQHAVALSGNVQMLTWLGKQRLEQKDKIENSGEIKTFLVRVPARLTQEQWSEKYANPAGSEAGRR